jgi:hypothetical protein
MDNTFTRACSTPSKIRLSDSIALAFYIVCAVASGVAIFAKIYLVKEHSSSPMLAALAATGVLAFALPVIALFLLRWSTVIAPVSIAAMLAVVVFAAPKIALLHQTGRGSDQGDCIIVAAHRMAAHLWPYDRTAMWSHNPMSCGPAWAILHMPFLTVLTYPLTMFALILLSLAVIAWAKSVLVAMRLTLLLACVPGFWLALADGNDLGVFAILTSAIVAISGNRMIVDNNFILAVVTLLSAMAAQARLPFLLLPIAVLSEGERKVQIAGYVGFFLSLAIWIAFYEYNRASFTTDGPADVVDKLLHSLGGVTKLGFAIGAGIAAILVLIASRFMRPRAIVLVYLIFVLLPISALNLVEKVHQNGGLLAGLERWEGTSWVTGVACYAAYLLASNSGFVLIQSEIRPGQN